MSTPAPPTTMRERAPLLVRPGLTWWFGLALAITSISSFLAWRVEAVSWPMHALVSCPCLYFLCICVHDGVHGVLLRRRQLGDAGAWLLSLVIGLPFPLLKHAHLKHHRRVGHADDPEAAVYRASPFTLALRLPIIPLLYLRSLRDMRSGAVVLTAAHLTLVTTTMGWLGAPGVLGWGAPALLAIAWFGFTTVYVPHGPFARPLMAWLGAHSGWHDDHHRDPRFPFHQYAAVRAFHLDHDLGTQGCRRADPLVFALSRSI